MSFKVDTDFMQVALKEAQKAFEKEEIPVGAIIVQDGKIIAKAHNQTQLLNDTTAHAEILALTSAYQYLGSKYIPDATLYVTLEPCLMCAGALYWSKIGRIVYGASDDKNGYRTCCHTSPFHPKTILSIGILSEQSATLMKDFFKQKRK